VPVGVSELRVVGLPLLPLTVSRAPQALPCGSGPRVSVDGRSLSTAVTASAADLYAGRLVRARVCGDRSVTLAAGTDEVDVAASAAFVPSSFVLTDGLPTEATVRDVGLDRADPVHRSLVPAGGSVVSVHENVNPGWTAEQAGQRLVPLVVDGWQQAWRLTGAGTVRMTYTPDRAYRMGLLGGLVGLSVLALACCLPARRWRGTSRPPLAGRTGSRVVLAGTGMLGAGLLAGWWALLLAAVVLVAIDVAQRRAPETVPWVVAAAVLPAAAAYALRPWGGQDGWAGVLAWPHYLVVVVVAALFVPAPSRGRRRRLFRRIPGRSTPR